ncbi:uncharacterized protein LOC143859357 [Tasmannia lanceolata]|uniref:uncharacterized protein LOC143859357 n=1 Tax=Tasmannia lanceolata TaxID=3420 RepID=UPI004063DC0E
MAAQGSGPTISASTMEEERRRKAEEARLKHDKAMKRRAAKAGKESVPTIESKEIASPDKSAPSKRQAELLEKSPSKMNKSAKEAGKGKGQVVSQEFLPVEGCEGTQAYFKSGALPRDQATQQGSYFDPNWKVGIEDSTFRNLRVAVEMAMTSVLLRDLADLERSSHSSLGRDMVAVAKKLSDICSHASRRMKKYHSLYAHASKEIKNQEEARANDKKVFDETLEDVRKLQATAEAELQRVKDELGHEKEARAELEKARDKASERRRFGPGRSPNSTNLRSIKRIWRSTFWSLRRKVSLIVEARLRPKILLFLSKDWRGRQGLSFPRERIPRQPKSMRQIWRLRLLEYNHRSLAL